MHCRALLAMALISVIAPSGADTLLWDNGDPDWRTRFVAITDPPDSEPTDEWPVEPGFSDKADDFENEAPWLVTRISLQGLFGPIGRDEDPEWVVKSKSVRVQICSPADEGGPGQVFWGLSLQGSAAEAAQTLTADISLKTFSDDEARATSRSRGKLVEMDVQNPDGLVTLPPGKWFVVWRIERSECKEHFGGGFPFWCLSSAHPRPGFDGDQPLYGRGCRYSLAEKMGGESAVPWRNPVFREPREYNLSFRIYGEKQ